MGFLSDKKYCRVSMVAAKLGNKILAPMQYEKTMDGVLCVIRSMVQAMLTAHTTEQINNGNGVRSLPLWYMLLFTEKEGSLI